LLSLLNRINSLNSLQFHQLVRYLSVLLIGILLSKSGLNINDIGIYETFIFLSGLFTFFWISGNIQGLLSTYDEKKPEIIFNVFIIISLYSLLITLFIVLLFRYNLMFINMQLPVKSVIILCIYILFANPSYLIEYIYFLKKDYLSLMKYSAFINILQIILVVLPVYYTKDIMFCFYGLLFSAVIKFLWLVLIIYKYQIPIVCKLYEIKNHLVLSIPLILSIMFSASSDYIDSIIISKYFDKASFAIYRFGARELPLTFILANTLSNYIVSQINTSGIELTLNEVKRKSASLINILFPFSTILILTSFIFYPIIFNVDFYKSALIFNIFLISTISRLVFPQSILIGLKENKIILISSIIEIFLNVVLSLILLNYFGIAGIALASVIAYSIDKVILIVYCKIKLGINPSSYIPIKNYLILSSLLLISFWFSYYIFFDKI